MAADELNLPRSFRRGMLNDDQIHRIARLHREGLGRNAIARELQIPPVTVSAICKQLHLEFDRAKTKSALDARLTDAALAEAELRLEYLEAANEALLRRNFPVTVFNFGGRDNVYREHELEAPPIADYLKLMQASAVAMDKAMRLADRTVDSKDLPAVDRWLDAMTGGPDKVSLDEAGDDGS